MNRKPKCDHQAVDRFLSEIHNPCVPDDELAQHLSDCSECQVYFASQVAPENFWREASDLLKPNRFDSAGRLEYSAGSMRAVLEHSTQIDEVLARLAPTDDPDSLGRIGCYEISGVVGAGAMGVVLKAFDPALDRVIAIKVLAAHLANSGTARERFAREAKAVAAIPHPNVISIHSVSAKADLPYFVMSYIRGESLRQRIEKEGPLQLNETLRVGHQVASGLAAAHERGLVHRDIKPANILLEGETERVTITDFGLARAVDDVSLTLAGVIAGTPQYMSPEQSNGEPIDQRSDLFSLGSVLYTLCTGRAPFRSQTSYGLIREINESEPPPIQDLNPAMPDWFCTLISKLLSKDRAQRYQEAKEVEQLLETCLRHTEQPASIPIPNELLLSARPIAWWPRSTSTNVFGAIGAISLLCIATVGSLLLGPDDGTQVSDGGTRHVAEEPIPTAGLVPSAEEPPNTGLPYDAVGYPLHEESTSGWKSNLRALEENLKNIVESADIPTKAGLQRRALRTSTPVVVHVPGEAGGFVDLSPPEGTVQYCVNQALRGEFVSWVFELGSAPQQSDVGLNLVPKYEPGNRLFMFASSLPPPVSDEEARARIDAFKVGDWVRLEGQIGDASENEGRSVFSFTGPVALYHLDDAPSVVFNIGIKNARISRVSLPLDVVQTRASLKTHVRGKWMPTRIVEDGQVATADENENTRIIFRDNSMQMLSGSLIETSGYKLRFSRWIDLQLRGDTQRGIYEVKGDRMLLCFNRAGGSRPKTFDAPSGSSNVFMILGRQHLVAADGTRLDPTGPMTESLAKALLPEAASINNGNYKRLSSSPNNSDLVDSQSLTTLLMTLSPNELGQGDGFRYHNDEVLSSTDLAGAIWTSRNKGYASMIQPEYITSCEIHKLPTGRYRGTVRFQAPKMYVGSATFEAGRQDGEWRIDKFEMREPRIVTALIGDGNWRQSSTRAKDEMPD